MNRVAPSVVDVYTTTPNSSKPPLIEEYSGVDLRLAPVAIPASVSSHNIITTSRVTTDVAIPTVTAPNVDGDTDTDIDIDSSSVQTNTVYTLTFTAPSTIVDSLAMRVPTVTFAAPDVTTDVAVAASIASVQTLVSPAVEISTVEVMLPSHIVVPNNISQLEEGSVIKTAPLPQGPHIAVQSDISNYKDSSPIKLIMLVDIPMLAVPTAVTRIKIGKATPTDISSVGPSRALSTVVLTEAEEYNSKVKMLAHRCE